MKKTLYPYIALLLPALAVAQSQDQNYVRTTTYKTETSASIASPTAAQAAQSITYFDGLGRPVQQRAHRQSGSGKDLVTPVVYDALGRQAKEYLPYPTASASLDYDPNAEAAALSYYASAPVPAVGGFETTASPFSQKLFEASPLNRVLQQAAPGNAWALGSGHEVKTEYLANSAADNVKYYKAIAAWQASQGLYTATLVQQPGSSYPAGQLYKTVTKNENWTSGTLNTAEEYKDKEGRVVMKRTYVSAVVRGNTVIQSMDTYYVYDQFANLSFVLTPLVTAPTQQLDGQCYQYRYDRRNRLVEKKLPGKQWEFIIYDSLDRPVATGPAYAPFSDLAAGATGWLVTKYDAFGRTAYTGWMPATVTSAESATLQAPRDAQAANLNEAKASSDNTVNGVAFRYTSTAWPVSGYHVLSVNYYDDYAFPNAPGSFPDVEGQPAYYNLSVKPAGLPTGSWTRVLESSTAYAGEASYTLYDKKARPIRTRTANYMGGHTQADSRLDFSGKALYTVTYHKRTASDTELAVREDFAYTDQDRLLSHTHKINASAAELLARNEYDERGQLVRKSVGGSDTTGTVALQKADYAYTVRGWLKGINDTGSLAKAGDPGDLFAFGINYQAPISAQPLFNGNIAETLWRTASDDKLRRYAYGYDAVNRLTAATYVKEGLMTGSYNEAIEYDRNGNITALQRNGGLDSDSGAYVQIDDLYYTYDGTNRNRLLQVEDLANNPQGFKQGSASTPSFYYDDNGNMVQDLNKGITSIRYNHLNLPVKVVFGSESEKIEYLYDAAGKKMRKTVTTSTTGEGRDVDYLDGYQYMNARLSFFPTAEGYVRVSEGKSGYAYSYVYNYNDHLGNIRLSYAKDPENPNVLKILEENHYYPFGLKHTNYNSDLLVHRADQGSLKIMDPNTPVPLVLVLPYGYKYNGKEFQDEMGMNWYDYGARNYDPAIGRWMNVDPLAETSRRWSPYTYCYNNPLVFVDPDGMQAKWKPDRNGNLIAEKGDNVATLAKYLGTTTKNVSNSFKLSSTGKNVPENHQFTEGKTVKLNNNVTRAIERSNGGSVEEINTGKAKQDVVNDNYVCDDCAQMAANGEEITPENASKYSQFPNPIAFDSTPGFTEVESFENVSFNKGIASIGGQHTVSYYGTSKDGTVNVATKNGRQAKPTVSTLQEVINQFNKDQGTNFTMKDVKYYKKNENK